MPTTIRLTTMPAKKQKGRGYTSLVLDLFGASLGTETITVSRVTEIAPAVKTFGDSIHAAHPEASFRINITLLKGQRKPAGFDAAQNAGQFGEDAFIYVETESQPLNAFPGSPAAAP